MITSFFVAASHGIGMNHVWFQQDGWFQQHGWFQQDGASCHTSYATVDVLREMLDGRVISLNGDINWPPSSCDLIPLDYFLWSTIKKSVIEVNQIQLGS